MPDRARTPRHRLRRGGPRREGQARRHVEGAVPSEAPPDVQTKGLEVLGRDPDSGGLNHYRQLWRDGWTQGRIRDDLRRSTEGRESYARTVITRAYRDLLGRDPDPGGYATYERNIRERGWSERQVREAIMSSQEYRQRQRRR